jgi:hypothetical protein
MSRVAPIMAGMDANIGAEQLRMQIAAKQKQIESLIRSGSKITDANVVELSRELDRLMVLLRAATSADAHRD